MAENIRKISVSQPTVTEEDKAAVLDCLDKTFLSGDSPVVAEFESNFSNAVDRNYGIAVANGSVARKPRGSSRGKWKGGIVAAS